MITPLIYVRGLKVVNDTVFCVSSDGNMEVRGQKMAYDPIFGRMFPYSSGQQVKRSIIDQMMTLLGKDRSSHDFVYKITHKGEGKKKLKTLEEGNVWTSCDPRDPDQLVCGYMKTTSADHATIKRKAGLAISSMVPVHVLSSGARPEGATIDRSDHPHLHRVTVYGPDGNEMTPEEIEAFCVAEKRNVPMKHMVAPQPRVRGGFVYNLCIDPRILFSVTLDKREPALLPGVAEQLIADGWVENRNVFGPCLTAPREMRERIIPALANAVIDWRITSNQSRAFSPMITAAVVISNDANRLMYSIRSKLTGDVEKPSAALVLEEMEGADLFITPEVESLIYGMEGYKEAIPMAIENLENRLREFDYENQI